MAGAFTWRWAVFALLAAGAASTGQSVELRLESTTLEVGEAVDAQLVCVNVGSPTPPSLTAPPGLRLELLNSTPQLAQSTKIVNGRMSQTSRYTYLLRVTALQEGKYRLGPFAVQADGKTHQTTPIDVEVRKPEAAASTSANKGDRTIWLELDVAPKSLYVTQSYRASLTIGIRKVESGGRIVDINNLLGTTIDANGSQLGPFTSEWTRSNEVTLLDSAGKRHRYEVFRCTKQIRAEEVGEIVVGPVFIKANYPTELQRGWPFGDLEVSATRKETARADAVTVAVKGPPEQGRPSDFTGSIGQFTFEVSAKPNRVEQGQPITLAILIRGNPLEGVAPPNIATQPELAARFEFTQDELAGDMEQGAKVFRRALFPKLVGEQDIPSLTWSYFDPQQERYVTLAGNAIPITVDPSSSPVDAESLSTEREANTTLTLLQGGLSPNHVDLRLALASQEFALSGWHLAILGGSPLACLALTWTGRRRARLALDRGWARRRQARRNAHRRIRRALAAPAPAEQLAGLADALAGYLADRFDLPPGTLTPREARTMIEKRGSNGRVAEDVGGFLEVGDAVRFASGGQSPPSPAEAAADCRRWIDQIERIGP